MPTSPHSILSFFRKPLRVMLACLLAGCILTGCAPMTAAPEKTNYSSTNVPQDKDGLVTIDTSKPIPFDRHNFDAHCFDTYGCTVLYNNRYMAHDPDDQKKPPSSSMGDRFPGELSAGNISIQNYPHFPPPAQVSWRSADGQPHLAEVDFEQIFKDKTVNHRVPQDQLPPVINMPILPDIVLVVDDRTIDVYTRAVLYTTKLEDSSNPYSNSRNDMIKVYSKTY